MTKDQLDRLFDRLRVLPPDRQADVARFVELVAEQEASDVQLTSEQIEEVRRRMSEDDPVRIPAEEVFRGLRSRIR